jgi:hypothetical protein
MPASIVCLSASNVEMNRANSASTRAIVLDQKKPDQVKVEIIPLLDYDMKPCRMCGQCFDSKHCAHDQAFNQIMDSMAGADALFLVCPHYAPFPSKVMILLEKLEEIFFLSYCANPDFHFNWRQKPMGIIAHGGQPETALPYYKSALLAPLAAAFRAVQANVLGADASSPDGVVFGIRSIDLPAGSIFVRIDHDWDAVRQRITPLVHNVLNTMD